MRTYTLECHTYARTQSPCLLLPIYFTYMFSVCVPFGFTPSVRRTRMARSRSFARALRCMRTHCFCAHKSIFCCSAGSIPSTIFLASRAAALFAPLLASVHQHHGKFVCERCLFLPFSVPSTTTTISTSTYFYFISRIVQCSAVVEKVTCSTQCMFFVRATHSIRQCTRWGGKKLHESQLCISLMLSRGGFP